MRLLAVDPGSRRCGWALLDPGDKIVGCGVIAPKVTLSVDQRIAAIVAEVLGLAVDAQECVVECPAKNSAARVKKAAGHGLAIYGEACGAVLWALRSSGFVAHRVDAEEWTRGRPKAKRAKELSLIVGRDFTTPGLDDADAVGLGIWWMTERRMRG